MILVSSLALASALAQPPVVPPSAPPPPPIVTVPSGPRTTFEVLRPGAPPAPPRPLPPLPTPTAAARELALKLVERIALFDRQAQLSVQNQLRWSADGSTCLPSDPECRRIAEEIAVREAPRMAREARDGVSRVLGARFDLTMSAAQIDEARRFFSDDAGQAFIGSFLSLNERALAALEPAFASFSGRRGELAAEFAARTRHLPRAPQPVAPPPPPAPPPPTPPPPPNR